MKILITGACGFIGSHCARLLNKHHQITLLDKSSYTLRLSGTPVTVLKKDLSIERDVKGILKGMDVVIHFAAETFVDYSISNPRRFLESNVIGTFNLLEEARRNKVKRFIHISTDEVYGSIGHGFFSEDMRLTPGNPYSASKAAADMFAISYQNTFGLPISILRCENNYGAYQGKEKAIPTWIAMALKGKQLPLYGDGRHKRMWLRVEDFCSAINAVLEHGKNEIYNVGSGQESENIQIVEQILGVLKKPKDLITFLPNARPGHDRRYAVDTSKIKALGWKPRYNLEESLPDVVKWYVDNQWWLK